jgi:hypothetical protein
MDSIWNEIDLNLIDEITFLRFRGRLFRETLRRIPKELENLL